MFPATSLPRRISNFGFRISDFVLSETSGDNREIRNSKSANPKLIWNSWQDSNPHLRRSKRRTLPIELQEREDCRFSISNCQLLLPKTNWKSAIGNRQCFQLAIGNDFGRGGQNRTVTTSAQDSDACITPHPDEDQFRVPSSEFRVQKCWFQLETLNSKLETVSSFHADHLLDLGDDFDQVFLVLHHLFD